MTKQKLHEKLINYTNALGRLEELVQSSSDATFLYDATIKRFEFTYELAWRLLKTYLEYKGIVDARSPREVIKEAFVVGIIQNGEEWLDMIEDRNLTTHTYSENDSFEIYLKIKDKYFHLFNLLKVNILKEV